MIHQNNNGADNFFATATKEELVDYLVNKIHKEVEKGDGADCDLIRECSDWLDELTKDEVIFTPEELKQNLEKIKANVLSDKQTKNRKRFSAKTFVRVALIAAVIFTISILSLSVVASNEGYDSTWEYISENINKLFGMSLGEKINDSGITVIKNTVTVRYNNMDELLQSESLNILYPSVLPENNIITVVHIVEETTQKYTMYFTFSNTTDTLTVANYYSSDPAAFDGFKCITVNNLNYYIKNISDEMYYTILQHNGFEYIIQSTNYDNMLIIINNMKG